jgi:hypothetical protein
MAQCRVSMTIVHIPVGHHQFTIDFATSLVSPTPLSTPKISTPPATATSAGAPPALLSRIPPLRAVRCRFLIVALPVCHAGHGGRDPKASTTPASRRIDKRLAGL